MNAQDRPDASFGELSKMIAAEWRSLTDDQRDPFLKLNEADRARYDHELHTYPIDDTSSDDDDDDDDGNDDDVDDDDDDADVGGHGREGNGGQGHHHHHHHHNRLRNNKKRKTVKYDVKRFRSSYIYFAKVQRPLFRAAQPNGMLIMVGFAEFLPSTCALVARL